MIEEQLAGPAVPQNSLFRGGQWTPEKLIDVPQHVIAHPLDSEEFFPRTFTFLLGPTAQRLHCRIEGLEAPLERISERVEQHENRDQNQARGE